ncbi:sulfotransferase family 2 domain-containing protein [Flavobacteriaceae bacterium TK19130]|nr:sulfotransferase family 2 domain-containing protein [Thermobacterium salinum]
MIISHKHRFIFIKTRKTAGTSIEIALSKICGDADILTPINPEDEEVRKEISGKTAQNYLIPFSKYSVRDWLRLLKNGKRVTYFNHMSATDVKARIDSRIWEDYFTFCFDREPMSKAISHYKWRRKKVNYADFGAYLASGDTDLIHSKSFYTNNQGKVMVDAVYKMEEMDVAFHDIAARIGVETLEPPAFKTKSTRNETDINPIALKQQYGNTLRKLFHQEYTNLYDDAKRN